MSHSIEYWGNEKPKCPHCDADFDVWGGDNAMLISYEDGGNAALECASCHKDFVAVTSLRYVFATAVSEEAADDEEWGPQQKDDAEGDPDQIGLGR